MLRILIVWAVVLMQLLVHIDAIRVYEDIADQEGSVDLSANSNSTGPVVYPAGNNTEEAAMMTMNVTDNFNASMMETMEPMEPMDPIIMAMENDSTSNGTSLTSTNMPNTINSANETIELRSNVQNDTMQIPAQVKENSSLRARQSYLHRPESKPFKSSPKDITTKLAQQATSLDADSFQPMIKKPFLPSPPLHQQPVQTQTRHQYQAPPKSSAGLEHITSIPSPPHFEPNGNEQEFFPTTHPTFTHESIRINSGRDLAYKNQQLKQQTASAYNSIHQYTDKGADAKWPSTIDYDSFQKNFFPADFYSKNQQPKYNSLTQYTPNEPNIVSNNHYISWPENQDNDDQKQPIAWTTAQPEFQTHPYKYLPTPTVYEAPKGFFSSALSMLTQSLKPSIPSRPYSFELAGKHQPTYFSSTPDYHSLHPQLQHTHHSETSGGPKDFEKYEIITTSSPEYHYLLKPPPPTSVVHHEVEVVKPPHHHNLPWHKIIKILSAIIPFGLLVSALTPNVVLINPNVTSTKNGGVFPYLSRQRSLEPDHIFNERIMRLLNELDDQNPQSICIRQSICQAIDSNKVENLTPDEYQAFQERLCTNVGDVSLKC